MTQAGVLIGVFSFSGLLGNLLRGVLADRFGRKVIVLFGLVFSALSSVTMGLVDNLNVFYILAVVVGLLSDVAGPAWQVMVADILPEEKRAEGFSVMRMAGNLDLDRGSKHRRINGSALIPFAFRYGRRKQSYYGSDRLPHDP